MQQTAAKTWERFVAAINSHNVQALTSLLTADPSLVDALGNRVRGLDSLEAAWRGYFAICPDYWIRTEHVLAESGVVLASGEAGGTIDGTAWRIRAAWKALICEDKVAEWQVFADNKPVYEILAKRL